MASARPLILFFAAVPIACGGGDTPVDPPVPTTITVTPTEVSFASVNDTEQLSARVFDQHAVLARTASFLGVTGTVQKAGEVVHLVADTLWRPELDAGPNAVGSRDFH